VCKPVTGSHGMCGPMGGPTRARYAQAILAAITERQRSREQYTAAKAVDTVSATGPPPSGVDVHAGFFLRLAIRCDADPNSPMLTG
jgi:hypothetical protein